MKSKSNDKRAKQKERQKKKRTRNPKLFIGAKLWNKYCCPFLQMAVHYLFFCGTKWLMGYVEAFTLIKCVFCVCEKNLFHF